MTFEKIQEDSKEQFSFGNWPKLLAGNPNLQAAVNLIKEIEKLQPESVALIVGGSVRDLLLRNKPNDIDIATNVPLDKVTAAFKTHNIGMSKDFGIIVVPFEGYTFEVAQFREDGTYSDNRRPDSVKLINDFKGDASRRDFTINSFGLTGDGQVIDYHKGIVDLEAKLIRTVGPARQRFTEDAVRILRVARFAGSLGFTIEPDTHQAMIELKHLLENISKERIAGELYKAAKSGPSLAGFVNYLDVTGILKDILPEVYAFKPFVHNIKHHPEGGGTVFGHVLAAIDESLSKDPVTNLAVLFHDLGKAVTYKNRDGKHTYYGHEAAGVPIIQTIGERLKLSADDIAAMQFAAANHMLVHKLGELNVKTLTRLVHDRHWPVLKEVSYADEACRGPALFDPTVFEAKIRHAEEKVQNLSARGGAVGLHKRIKEFVDGNKLMCWIPELLEPLNKRKIGLVLSTVQDWILENIDAGHVSSEQDIIDYARTAFSKLQ